MSILTAAEAANALRCAEDDALMLQLLPQVDAYIYRATGRDWSADSPISERAKSAATMLVVAWHENPAMIGTETGLQFGLSAVLTQLESDALRYRIYAIDGLDGGGSIYLDEYAKTGAQIVALVGITGVSGDQSDKFESVLTTDYYITQTSTEDLSDNQYLITLISAADAVLI